MTKAKVLRRSPIITSSVAVESWEQFDRSWMWKHPSTTLHQIHGEGKSCTPNLISPCSHQNTPRQSRSTPLTEINLSQWREQNRYQTITLKRKLPGRYYNSMRHDQNKYENGNKNINSTKKIKKCRILTEKKLRCRKRTVRFNPKVFVKQIRSHRHYSSAAKSFIWSSTREIKINARRNAIEFRAEGRNWRHVVEENKMWTDMTNGDFIHPIHFPPLISKYYY